MLGSFCAVQTSLALTFCKAPRIADWSRAAAAAAANDRRWRWRRPAFQAAVVAAAARGYCACITAATHGRVAGGFASESVHARPEGEPLEVAA